MIDPITITITPEIVEAIAQRAAEIVLERSGNGSPWMDRKAAAAYLGWPVSRLEKRRDVPHVKDEGRVLYHRDQLDEYLLGLGR